MSLAVERAAKTHKEMAADLKLPHDVVLKDSNKLLRDTYVNDVTKIGNPGEVSCMIGHKLLNGEFTGTIPAMA